MTFRPDPKPYPKEREARETPKEKKAKFPKATGELALFKKIFAERGGRCEITKERLLFNVSCFMHILPKGSHPEHRLNPDNIMLVKYRIHWLYDNSTEAQLLKEFPGAKIIYEKYDELKTVLS